MADVWVIGGYQGGLFKIRKSKTCEWEVICPGKCRVKGKAQSYRSAFNMATGVIGNLQKKIEH